MGFITETDQAYYEGENLGGYQYVPIDDIITNFLIMFTGEGKVIPKANRTEVQMHAKRAMQEFSYDIFRSHKGLEIEVPPALTMKLPKDYVGWVKFSWIDSNGLERTLTPLRISSNPRSILQDSSYEYLYDGAGALTLANESVAWERLQSGSNAVQTNAEEIEESWDAVKTRFGMDPEFANANGGFYIDRLTGLIHFTSTTYGKIIHLSYISDGLGTDGETVIHKFAEDAIYKYILYAIIAVTNGAQEYLVRRYRKSFDAARRVAKIRLGDFKISSIIQMARGKSKQIKH